MATPPPPPPPPDYVPPPRPRRSRAVPIALFLVAIVLVAFTLQWVFTTFEPFPGFPSTDWALDLSDVSDLHGAGFDGSGIVICVVDTGVDLSHADLGHVDVRGWRDLVNGRASPYDDEGHGTAMVGVIFGQGQVGGVAPAAGLIAVKAIDASGSGSGSQVAEAIEFCVDPNGDGSVADGAHVISLSLGGGSHPLLGTAVEQAAGDAVDRGVLVVAAAGNDGQDDDGDVDSPASVDVVIAVGAVDREGVIAPFSSQGSATTGIPPQTRQDPDKKPEVVAPGVELPTTLRGGAYGLVSGTSPAAAFVAGVLALLLEANPVYRHNPTGGTAVKVALMEAASPASGQTVPHDLRYGYGIVQAAATSASL